MMDSLLRDALAEVQADVDRRFDGLLPVPADARARLYAAMRHAAIGGGKRLRPLLVHAAARLFDVSREASARVGVALEAIHVYSLIHDDLPAMDDDDLRRGRPTCHKAFGENVAILAGDGLYAEAFRLVLEQQAGEPAAVLAAVRELAFATGVNGMVGGQYLDVTHSAPRDATGLRHLHSLKTGRLIGASIICPLLLGPEQPPATIKAFRSFASELGVLFQIVDDILDVVGTDDALGKAPGGDERLGKRTYVSEFGLERARELAAESHRKAQDALAEAVPGGAGELSQITDFIYTRTS